MGIDDRAGFLYEITRAVRPEFWLVDHIQGHGNPQKYKINIVITKCWQLPHSKHFVFPECWSCLAPVTFFSHFHFFFTRSFFIFSFFHIFILSHFHFSYSLVSGSRDESCIWRVSFVVPVCARSYKCWQSMNFGLSSTSKCDISKDL